MSGRFAGYAGTVSSERIFHIGIDGRSVALKLPVSRYIDLVPIADVIVFTVESGRSFPWIAAPVKQPLPVKTDYFAAIFPFGRSLQRGMVRQFVYSQYCGVFPVIDNLSLDIYGKQREQQRKDLFFHFNNRFGIS